MRIRVAVMNFGQAVEKKPSVSEARPLEGIRLALSIRTTRTGCPLDSTLWLRKIQPLKCCVHFVTMQDWVIFKISVKTRIIYHHQNPINLKLRRVWIAVFIWSGSELWESQETSSDVCYLLWEERQDLWTLPSCDIYAPRHWLALVQGPRGAFLFLLQHFHFQSLNLVHTQVHSGHCL